MNKPTEEDIEASKAYLRQRLDAEHSMSYHVELLMREAAERIVAICFAAKITPAIASFDKLPNKVKMQIEEVVQWLREAIYDDFETLAIYDHEDNRDLLLLFILGVNHGLTFNERLSDYCTKYRDELLLLIGAGLFLKIPQDELTKTISDHLKHPYKNPDLIDGIDAPLTFGRGRTNSMLTAITALTMFGISQAWMRDWELRTAAKGAIGWEVRRGSSYPCSQCDENCGFHPIDEGTDLPQHNSCCCYAVPIYEKIN